MVAAQRAAAGRMRRARSASPVRRRPAANSRTSRRSPMMPTACPAGAASAASSRASAQASASAERLLGHAGRKRVRLAVTVREPRASTANYISRHGPQASPTASPGQDIM